jgi:hypothetical protein
MATIPPIEQLLVEDDAYRFLERLPEDERRSHFANNRLGPGAESFNAAEDEAMKKIYAPK